MKRILFLLLLTTLGSSLAQRSFETTPETINLAPASQNPLANRAVDVLTAEDLMNRAVLGGTIYLGEGVYELNAPLVLTNSVKNCWCWYG